MPSSLSGILSTARSGLLSHQLALQVTGHNLANATTEGYSRQRAELVPGVPLLLPEGLLGTGVRVADITRSRNQFLDSVYRRESALFHGSQAQSNALSSVEAAFGEPSDLGLGASIDAFWASWSDLANDPSSPTARGLVVAGANQVIDHFGRISSALDAVTTQVADGLQTGVERVNQITDQIAALNVDITAAVSNGNSAPDLADQRDRLIDELAQMLPVEVSLRESGAVGITVEGISIVEGPTARSIVASSVGGVWSLTTDTGSPLAPRSGTIGGAMETLNNNFANFRAGLDELAVGLVERVNAVHSTGVNPLGATGVNFFDDLGDPTTVTARTLALDAAVLADSQAVVAGSGDGGGAYQSGANDIALALAGLRDDTTGGVLAGRSINTAYRDLVGEVGLAAAGANDSTAAHDILRRSTLEQRESVSGVATDEELVKVVQIQAAYSAAARIVTVVDEMYQTLLAI